MNRNVLAVDIGATKAAIAMISSDLEIIVKEVVPTGKSSNIWEKIAEASINLISRSQLEIAGVGIASAGPIDIGTGEISPVNIPSWVKFPIVQKYSELLHTENIVLNGDAIALTHAEFKIGAGQGAENLLGMVVSTGIGGGLVLNKKLYTGLSGNAGYFGHHSIAFQSNECVCGRIGCVELFASGPQMVNYAKELGWKGQNQNFETLAESARLGDKFAIASIERGTEALSQAIVNVLCILDINLVVVGGGVVQAGDIYWKSLEEKVQKLASFSGFIGKVDLRKSNLNQNAGLIGAALGVLDR